MACIAMAYGVMAYTAMGYIVMAYIAMACAGMAYIAMAYVVMVCIVMAYVVMACVVTACIVMAYVMANKVLAYDYAAAWIGQVVVKKRKKRRGGIWQKLVQTSGQERGVNVPVTDHVRFTTSSRSLNHRLPSLCVPTMFFVFATGFRTRSARGRSERSPPRARKPKRSPGHRPRHCLLSTATFGLSHQYLGYHSGVWVITWTRRLQKP